MSKESHSSNLRLLGSPVNLTYRGKKKDDKKNIKNRPRSALQNSGYKPDYYERYRRPYSADANPRSSTNKNLQKSFSIEVIQCTPKPIKVVPPTTEILGLSKKYDNYRNRDLCSNASDYGSEDTFVSLGTKIKARAQSGPKPKTNKNLLKYREIAKNSNNFVDKKIDKVINDYNLEVKITEKAQGDVVFDKMGDFDDFDPFNIDNTDFGRSIYDARMPSEHCGDKAKINYDNEEALTSKLTKAEEYYSRQLTKQQLSLVEEESSQEFSSISPENSLENVTNQVTTMYNIEDKKTDKNHFKQDNPKDEGDKMSQNFVIEKQFEDRSYKSFYNDLQLTNIEPYRSRLSSTIGNTDESCKDSGYTDSGSNEDKSFKRTYSSPNSLSKKIDSTIFGQPKSLDSASFSKFKDLDAEKNKNEWSEPINHSRLLYKDFFIRKETNAPKVPENSPKEKINDKAMPEEKSTEYPSYLLNSTTKAYTSKVIEDYKKEIAAINNLHELTMKDIKIDAISPTPLNIDKMFEQNSGECDTDSNPDSQEKSEPKFAKYEALKQNKDEIDISKISTKELIQNYLKVKDNDFNKSITKNLKRYDRKYPTIEKNLNNKTTSNTIKSDIPMNVKNQIPTSKLPLSARIEPVQNDRDVDSWMSLTVMSPKNVENELKDTYEAKPASKDEETYVERNKPDSPRSKVKELSNGASVLDIYSMLKEIESFGDNPVNVEPELIPEPVKNDEEVSSNQKDNFMEIFDFLEKVEQSANDALAVVTNTTPQTIPKLESLLRLPQTELAQRLVTLSLQLEERSCCIALLQESLTNHKQQMVTKVSALEKQSNRNITKVKQECEEAIKRHQNFIDQLINDKKTLNHRIEQLVDERRGLEERWKRQAQALEDRYKLELKNQHDKMNAAQQVARQRWVRQKAEKIKELTVKGLEGELRDMADRQQKEVSDLKMYHAEQLGRMQAKYAADMEAVRQRFEDEKEAMLLKERQMASSRLEKQILELELTYQEQRTRLIAEMRAENERVASGLTEREKNTRQEIEKWREEQEEQILEKRSQLEQEIARERENLEEEFKKKKTLLEEELDRYKKQYEAEQQVLFKKKEKEICAQYKQERDKEIEKAIESMEAEAQVGRKELQEALRRNKEQYELELKELAETEQATLKRYQDAQSRIRITESKCPLHKFPKRHFRDRFNEWKAVLKEHTRNRSDTYLCNQVKLCYRHFEERFRLPSSLLTRNSVPTLKLTIVEETPTNTPSLSALQTAPESPSPSPPPQDVPLETPSQSEPTKIKIKRTKKDRKIRLLLLKLRAQRKQCAELEVTISKLETKNHLLTEKNMQLEQRTNEIKVSCEEKWRTKVEDLRKEMDDKTKKHEEQMHQLYAKVKIAVARKDSAMQALTREASKAQEKITLLEKKLQQQRKDFLKHK